MNTICITDDSNSSKIGEKTELYISIFGEEPWNEGYLCNDCSQLFSLSTVQNNSLQACACGGFLEPFYKKAEVQRDWTDWSQKTGYIEKLAETLEGNMVGFILGWETTMDTLNTDKLGLSDSQLKELLTTIAKMYPDFDQNRFFYAADMGVKKEWRSQGVASRMYKAREEEIIKKGIPYVVVRTTKKSDKPYKWYTNQGFLEVFDYADQQERVVLLKKLEIGNNYLEK